MATSDPIACCVSGITSSSTGSPLQAAGCKYTVSPFGSSANKAYPRNKKEKHSMFDHCLGQTDEAHRLRI